MTLLLCRPTAAAWLERRYGARIEWRTFDLHPEYPPEGISAAELDARYGGAAWRERLAALFAAEGQPHRAVQERVPNSRKALMLSERARDLGAYDDLHDRLFAAYWADGRDLGDDSTLVALAGEAGIPVPDAESALGDETLLNRVQASTREALELGAGGVPAWLVDDRLLVPGNQPEEVFAQVMARLGHGPV